MVKVVKEGPIPVIFRKWKNTGDVIALFPTIPATLDPYLCESYEHIGQHGAAEPVGVVQATKSAKPAEYKDLLGELKRIGYRNLVIYSRLQSDWINVRRVLIKKWWK